MLFEQNRVGIMQGRLLPRDLEKLQLFPEKDWERELKIAQDLGFGCFELLYDKELRLKTVLDNPANIHKLGLRDSGAPEIVTTKSVCLDFLADVSMVKVATRDQFIFSLQQVIRSFAHTSVKTLVVPFCDNNLIDGDNEMAQIMRIFVHNRIDQLAQSCDLQLALEIDLPPEMILKGFQPYDLKNIGICFDIGNITSTGRDARADLSVLNGLIRHVHIKDRPVGGPNVMLGDGDANFKACLEILNDIHYLGPMIFETRYFSDPIGEAQANLRHFKEQSL